MRSAIVSAVAIATLIVGCNDPASGPLQKQEVGEYGLQTVNGLTLPYLSNQNQTFKAEITGGSLELRNDGSFTETRTSRITQGSSINPLEAVTSGTYTKNGTQIVFTISGGAGSQAITYLGVLSTNSVAVTSGGIVFVYNKR